MVFNMTLNVVALIITVYSSLGVLEEVKRLLHEVIVLMINVSGASGEYLCLCF